jgi:hypothetical protein
MSVTVPAIPPANKGTHNEGTFVVVPASITHTGKDGEKTLPPHHNYLTNPTIAI